MATIPEGSSEERPTYGPGEEIHAYKIKANGREGFEYNGN